MKDPFKWIAGTLAVVVISLVSYVFVHLSETVEKNTVTIEQVNKTLNEVKLLLRANRIDWPEPVTEEERDDP
jgi:hypothetical protein